MGMATTTTTAEPSLFEPGLKHAALEGEPESELHLPGRTKRVSTSSHPDALRRWNSGCCVIRRRSDG